jgi:hypothetical protein
MDDKKSSKKSSNEPEPEKVPVKFTPKAEPAKAGESGAVEANADQQEVPIVNKTNESIKPQTIESLPVEEEAIAPPITRPGEVIQPTKSTTPPTTSPETPEVDPMSFSQSPQTASTGTSMPANSQYMATDNEGPHGNLQNAPAIVSSKRPRKGLKVFGILFVLLLLTVGIGYIYLYFIAPGRAFTSYANKIGNLERASVAGKIDVSVGNSGENLKAEAVFNGKVDDANTDNPKLQLAFDGDVGVLGISIDVRLEVIMLEEIIYIKPGQIGPLGALLNLDPDSWYSLPTSDLEDGACTIEDYTAIDEYISSSLANKLNPDIKRVGIFREEIEGHKVSHYRGVIEGEQILSVVKELNEKVSENCRSNVSNEEDLRKLSVAFDLWKGKEFDRLYFEVTGIEHTDKFNFTLDTFDYGQAVNIVAPSDPKSLEDFLSDGSGVLSPSSGTFTTPEDISIPVPELHESMPGAHTEDTLFR